MNGEILAHAALFLSRRYLEQLGSARPLLHVHLQTLVQEVLEHRGQLLLLFDLWLPIGSDQIQRLEGPAKRTVLVKWWGQFVLFFISGFLSAAIQ